MPTYTLSIDDGNGWMETIGRFPSRVQCYRAALESGEGEYQIIVRFRPEPFDREVRVNADGTVDYRIPGASNWHRWEPKP